MASRIDLKGRRAASFERATALAKFSSTGLGGRPRVSLLSGSKGRCQTGLCELCAAESRR